MSACTKAPEGWVCSRKAGHDGPCAASPARSEWLDELTAAIAAERRSWIETYDVAYVTDDRKSEHASRVAAVDTLLFEADYSNPERDDECPVCGCDDGAWW